MLAFDDINYTGLMLEDLDNSINEWDHLLKESEGNPSLKNKITENEDKITEKKNACLLLKSKIIENDNASITCPDISSEYMNFKLSNDLLYCKLLLDLELPETYKIKLSDKIYQLNRDLKYNVEKICKRIMQCYFIFKQQKKLLDKQIEELGNELTEQTNQSKKLEELCNELTKNINLFKNLYDDLEKCKIALGDLDVSKKELDLVNLEKCLVTIYELDNLLNLSKEKYQLQNEVTKKLELQKTVLEKHCSELTKKIDLYNSLYNDLSNCQIALNNLHVSKNEDLVKLEKCLVTIYELNNLFNQIKEKYQLQNEVTKNLEQIVNGELQEKDLQSKSTEELEKNVDDTEERPNRHYSYKLFPIDVIKTKKTEKIKSLQEKYVQKFKNLTTLLSSLLEVNTLSSTISTSSTTEPVRRQRR